MLGKHHLRYFSGDLAKFYCPWWNKKYEMLIKDKMFRNSFVADLQLLQICPMYSNISFSSYILPKLLAVALLFVCVYTHLCALFRVIFIYNHQQNICLRHWMMSNPYYFKVIYYYLKKKVISKTIINKCITN